MGDIFDWNGDGKLSNWEQTNKVLHLYNATHKKGTNGGSGGNGSSGGCYIATCVYGSYDCPQVRTLRRFRDDILTVTWYGNAFIKIYYAVSPSLVKWLGAKMWFQNLGKAWLDKIVVKLQNKGFSSLPYTD